ncbi:hypothetical protein GWK47_003610 [Chionoecetes opilio]|uniref:Uncharacterized protein n=1 Tax=Chionoecetes opilio TaxID=41210 RepID=A0A8J5CQG7_CHIOP|nr:hypothetical protein GWK47_003610 [Chionoecetes opilio]
MAGPISAVIAQAALILAEQLADDPVVAAGESIVARYEQDMRQEEEREEERPPNPVRVRENVETIVLLYSQEDFKKHFRMQIAEGNQRAWETVECQALLLRVLVSQQCQALLLLQQEPCQDQQLYKERYILAKKKCPTL